MSTSRRRPLCTTAASRPWPGLSLLAAALAMGLALGGCTYLREAIGLGAQRPKVALANVEVVKASLAAIELMVTVRIDNPNDFALSFSKLRYHMVAGDLDVATGTYNDRISIPAAGHSLIKLPLNVDAVNALALVHALLTKREEIVAVLTAVADFETPVGAMEVNFEDKRPLKKLAGF